MSLPFPNIYSLKHVGKEDCKSCIVCYKLSDCVLISLNSKDWFYICAQHLSDKNFASLIYIDNDKDVTSELKVLVDKKNELLRENLKNKVKENETSWNIWKKKEDKKNDKKDETKNETKQDKEDEGGHKSSNDSEYEKIVADIEVYDKQHKKYKLDSVFFKNRLIRNYKMEKEREIRNKLKTGELFPSLEGLEKLKK